MGCVLVTSFIGACDWLLLFVVDTCVDKNEDVGTDEATAVAADDDRELFSTAFELGLPFVVRCVNGSLSLHAIFAVC